MDLRTASGMRFLKPKMALFLPEMRIPAQLTQLPLMKQRIISKRCLEVLLLKKSSENLIQPRTRAAGKLGCPFPASAGRGRRAKRGGTLRAGYGFSYLREHRSALHLGLTLPPGYWRGAAAARRGRIQPLPGPGAPPPGSRGRSSGTARRPPAPAPPPAQRMWSPSS